MSTTRRPLRRGIVALASAALSAISLAVVAQPAAASAVAHVSVSDTAVTKPASGTASMSFPISLLQPSDNTIRVNYYTSDGTAVSGRDYVYESGSVSIPPGQTVANVSIDVLGNTLSSGNRYFYLNLTNSQTYATIEDGQAAGSIIDPNVSSRLTVDDTAVVSPYTGGGSATFNVSLFPASANTVTVRYTTSDGNARANRQYTPQNGTLTFAPGTTMQTVSVPILGKVAPEDHWYFSLGLNTPRNAILSDDTGYAYIIDNNRNAQFTADDTSVTKPASGTTVVNVPVRLEQPVTYQTNVDYYTSDGSAVAGTDYVGTSGTLTFAAGSSTATAPVTINSTAGANPPRYFALNLTNQTGGTGLDHNAVVRIESTGALSPYISVQDTAINKPTSGSANVTVTVTAQPAPTSTLTVNYATSDGSAHAGQQYTATSGTLTFNAGQTTKTFTVAVAGNTTPENDPYFYNYLSANSAGAIERSPGYVTILNADASQQAGVLSVDRRSIIRPTSTATTMQVPVELSPARAFPVTVNYNTYDNTAVDGTDYTATSGTLTFAPGDAVEYVPVQILPNAHVTGTKNFGVSLNTPSNAFVDTGSVLEEIIDASAPPVLSVQDAAIYRPTLGTRQMTFTVKLSATTTNPVTFNWNTFDGSAHSPADYTASSGSGTIPAGKNSTKFVVPVTSNSTRTDTQYFGVSITSVVDAYQGRITGYGYILNDNVTPYYSAPTATVTAGAAATTMPFNVTLSTPSANTVTIDYTTGNGSATAGTDYTPTTGTVTFAPGETTKTVNVPIAANTVRTGTSYFYLYFSNPSNAQQGRRNYALGVIQYSAVTPQITIGDVAVTRQTTGTKNANFTVSMSPASTATVFVNYNTGDGSAQGGVDYTPTSGTLSFAPGETTKNVQVPIIANAASTVDRYFYVYLSSAVNASVQRNPGYAEIVNTVAPASGLSYATVDDSVAIAPTSGNANESFTVRISPAATSEVRIGYYTSDSDAIAGQDYTTKVGTLVFAPGQTSKTVTVPVLAQSTRQAGKTFYFNLRNPAGPVSIQRSSATGVILNQLITGHVVIGPDVSVVRGATGTTQTVSVSVTMTPAQTVPVRVDYHTEDESGGAVAGRDYDQQNGTLTFAPGQTSKTITLTVYGDSHALSNERFFVYLDGVSAGGATYYGEDQRADVYLDATQTFQLAGIVTDQNGNAVAGATLTRTGNNQPTVTTTSAADGTFSFNAIQGTYKVTPSGLGKKYFPTSVTTPLLPGQETPTTAGAFIAYTGNAIAGKTFDSGGTALPGATVTRTGNSQPTVSVTSNARGVWLIGTQVDGTYTLNATATGYTTSIPANYQVTVAGASVLTADLELVKKPYIAAHLVDGTGAGVDGATVTFAGPVTRTVKADVHGYYVADNLPNGTYTVTPSRSGHTYSPTSANATVNATTNGSLTFTES